MVYGQNNWFFCSQQCRIKRWYKKSVLRDLRLETKLDVVSYLKTIDLIKVVAKVAASWKMVSAASICKFWKTLVLLQHNWESRKQNVFLNDLFQQLKVMLSIPATETEVQKWIDVDEPVNEHLDDTDIVGIVLAADCRGED